MPARFPAWCRKNVALTVLAKAGPCHRYVSAFEPPRAPGVPVRRLLARPQVATGQGLTAREARLKAMAEAAERYSIVFQGNEDVLEAAFDEIADTAVHPHTLTQFSDTQYAGRESWNRGKIAFPQIPYRYEDRYPLLWYGTWSLTHDRPRCLPLQHVLMASAPEGKPVFQGCDSIGCAAGTTENDAFVRAFLELVERDALSIWWSNRVRRPAVDLAGFESRELRRLRRAIAADARELAVLDLTNDLGIPVLAAITWDRQGRNIAIGAGAHFDPRRALRRALTEAVQVGHESGAVTLKATSSGTLAGTWARWARRASVDREPHFRPSGTSPMGPAACAPDEDLAPPCLAAARAAGLEVIAIRLTRPEVALPVVRVIVPGLRHPWLRLAPGRLYDVPVAMGWLEQAKREAEMNPHPLAL